MLRNPLLVPDLRELLQAGEDSALREFLAEYHPARVAEIIEDLDEAEGDALYALLPGREQAGVMSYLDHERQERLVSAMTPTQAAALLHLMSHDDRADLVNRLDEDLVEQILPHLAQAERDDIRRLASYEPGTAGAVMTTDYVTLPPRLTVREALDRVRQEAPDREMIDYSYVVDTRRRLLGFVSLKRLILARPHAIIEDIMKHDAIVARVDEDQEAVARTIDRYDLFAVPVLDDSDMLVGIVTHDDAMDILRREQTKDILAFGGVTSDSEGTDDHPYWQGSIINAVRRRIGWLLMLFFTGTITIFVLRSFKYVDQRFEHLNFDVFVPLLIGIGGNAGSQTVGTIIRGLALGEISKEDGWRVLVREWLTGTMMGTMLGLIGFCFAWLMHGQVRFAAVIGLTILCICMWANSVGALVPLLARRLGIDPALVSAPLISTLVDATGLVIYYLLAILILINLQAWF
ncbi:magnesium transporter [Isosphaeraceae bacterium EP7]